jgi:Tol biopolymer transport system component
MQVRSIISKLANTLILLIVVSTASMTAIVLEGRLGEDPVHSLANTNDGNQYAWASTFPGTNGKIAYESDRAGYEQIFVSNPDGTNETNISNSNTSDQRPSWSPNGTKIVFNRFTGGNEEIFVMDADGSNQIDISNNPALDVDPSWSPDGTKIVFSSNRDGNLELYVMNANGTNPIRLTNSPAPDSMPSWSPNGTKIAFDRFTNGNILQIFVINPDGTNEVNISNSPVSDVFPNWSPNGTKIAFSSDRNRDGYQEIDTMNANGTNPIRLTHNSSADDFSPSFSPDSTKMSFVHGFRATNGSFTTEIYVMNADGTNPIRLTHNTAQEFSPRFGTLCDSKCKHDVLIYPWYITESIPWGGPTLFSIILIDLDEHEKPIPSKTIHFRGNGVFGIPDRVTDSNGETSGRGKAPNSVTYWNLFSIDFDGDSNYNPAHISGHYETTRHDVSIVVSANPRNVPWSTPFNISATLSDRTTTTPFTPLFNKTIFFVGKNMSMINGSTDVNGYANVRTNASSSVDNAIPIHAIFQGDDLYRPETNYTIYNSIEHFNDLTLGILPSQLRAGEAYNASGYLTDAITQQKLPSKTIVLMEINSNTRVGTATTDSTGRYEFVNLKAPAFPGVYVLQAWFYRDPLYAGKASPQVTLTVH